VQGKIVDGKEKSCFIQVGIDRSLLNDPVKPHSSLDSSTKKGSCLVAAPNLNRAPRKILASDGQMRVARALFFLAKGLYLCVSFVNISRELQEKKMKTK
jgi:hypothetical protein